MQVATLTALRGFGGVQAVLLLDMDFVVSKGTSDSGVYPEIRASIRR